MGKRRRHDILYSRKKYMSLSLGDAFELSFIVDQVKYSGFINLFNDNNPLHVNAEFAKKLGFSDVVMHGNILNGFLSFFIGECLPIKNVIIHSQEIQFKKPVYLNDKLDFIAKVSEFYESVNVYVFKFDFFNHNSVKVAKGKIQIGILT